MVKAKKRRGCDIMEEIVLRVLSRINEDIVTYDGENLFDAGILDSLQVVDIIAALEDELDIDIDAECVIEENLKTKETIIDMINRIVGS